MIAALIIGHKHSSPGAANKELNINEFSFNKTLVNDIVTYFNRVVDDDIKLIQIYRDTYKSLPDKVNKIDFNFVISFHVNAFNKKVSGSEVLYYHKSNNGRKMAKILQKGIVESLKLKNRGIKSINSEARGGYLLKHTKAPCVIIEPFFIDNMNDCFSVRMNYEELVISFIKSISEISKIL